MTKLKDYQRGNSANFMSIKQIEGSGIINQIALESSDPFFIYPHIVLHSNFIYFPFLGFLPTIFSKKKVSINKPNTDKTKSKEVVPIDSDKENKLA